VQFSAHLTTGLQEQPSRHYPTAVIVTSVKSPPISTLFVLSVLSFPLFCSPICFHSLKQTLLCQSYWILPSLSSTTEIRLAVLQPLMKAQCIQWNTSRTIHLFLHPSRNSCNFSKIYTFENHCTMWDLTVCFVFLG